VAVFSLIFVNKQFFSDRKGMRMLGELGKGFGEGDCDIFKLVCGPWRRHVMKSPGVPVFRTPNAENLRPTQTNDFYTLT